MSDKKKAKIVKSEIVQQPVAQLKKVPAGYVELLEDLKERIRSARIQAGLAVNRELVLLYWRLAAAFLNNCDIQRRQPCPDQRGRIYAGTHKNCNFTYNRQIQVDNLGENCA